MTKILVVDDEPAQSRGLSRAILLRRPDDSVSTATSGAEAIELLQTQNFDLVITDLQMPNIDGFELLVWLLNHRPGVLAFAMSSFCDDEAQARLKSLGSVECLAKPLDVDALLERVQESLAQSLRGHVDNVGLASFLQLVELEQKTCTLEVHHDHHVGKLYLRRGELVDAATGQLEGEEAALDIIGWLNVDIAIDGSCNTTRRSIDKPAHFVVMEAMRRLDERLRNSDVPSNGSNGGMLEPPYHPFTGEPRRRRTSTLPKRTLGAVHVPMGAIALILIERATGFVIASHEGGQLNVNELAQSALDMLTQQSATLALSVGAHETLQELVVMTSSRGELIKPLPEGDRFVLLVFDPNATNLVMARYELDRFVREYSAS